MKMRLAQTIREFLSVMKSGVDEHNALINQPSLILDKITVQDYREIVNRYLILNLPVEAFIGHKGTLNETIDLIHAHLNCSNKEYYYGTDFNNKVNGALTAKLSGMFLCSWTFTLDKQGLSLIDDEDVSQDILSSDNKTIYLGVDVLDRTIKRRYQILSDILHMDKGTRVRMNNWRDDVDPAQQYDSGWTKWLYWTDDLPLAINPYLIEKELKILFPK